MYKYILLLVVIIVAFAMYKNKIRIKWKTFFKKGVRTSRGIWGTYCYEGNQGEGKTASMVAFLHDNNNLEIYANINSLKNIEYTYINGVEGLLNLIKFLDKKEKSNKQIVILYDEIFTLVDRNSKLDNSTRKDIIKFLSQMRKRKIIFLTSVQCWGELPLYFRRLCRFEISCHIISLPFFSIIIKSFFDAEHMKYDKELQDFVAPIIGTYVSKVRKSILTSYDTTEVISS